MRKREIKNEEKRKNSPYITPGKFEETLRTEENVSDNAGGYN